MEMNMTDILLLFILCIVAALIIAINLIYVVDKKLNDVQINVPPAVCPTPNIYIKGINGEINKVNVKTSNHAPTKKQIVKYSPLNNDNYQKSNEQNIERYETVEKSNEGRNSQYLKTNLTDLPLVITGGVNSVANLGIAGYDFPTGNIQSPYNDLKNRFQTTILLKQGYNDSGSNKPNTGNSIMYPSADDVVRYNGPGCFQDLDTRNIRKVIDNDINKPMCLSNMTPGAINKIKTKFMEGEKIIDQEVDLYVPEVYMGLDPYIKGVSYSSYSIEIPADIDQIGSIPVNDYQGEPKPVNDFASKDD
jgi:hypothetical protein